MADLRSRDEIGKTNQTSKIKTNESNNEIKENSVTRPNETNEEKPDDNKTDESNEEINELDRDSVKNINNFEENQHLDLQNVETTSQDSHGFVPSPDGESIVSGEIISIVNNLRNNPPQQNDTSTGNNENQIERSSSEASAIGGRRIQSSQAHPNLTAAIRYDSSTEIYRLFTKYGNDKMSKATLEPMETFIYMAIPLDGGYAWVILIVAFFALLIGDGIIFSLGLILPDIADDLGLDNSQLALIVALQVGAYFMSGPFAGAFVHKQGFRPVAISGAAIASVAFFIASYSNGMTMLTSLFAIAGSAFGFLGCVTQLILSYYFEKYRPLALGIASSGSGAGLLTFSTLNKNLLTIIDWRSLLRLHAAFAMFISLCVVLYIELKPAKIGRIVDAIDGNSESNDSVEIASMRYSVPVGSSRASVSKTEHFIDNLHMLNVSKRLKDTTSRTILDDKDATEKENCFQRFCFKLCSKKSKKDESNNLQQPSDPVTRRYIIEHDPLDREDIFYTGPPNVSTRSGDLTTMLEGHVEIHPEQEHRTQSINYTLSMLRTVPNETNASFKWCPPKMVEAFHLLFDMKLFHKKEFNLLFLAAFLFIAGSNIPYMYATHRCAFGEPYRSMVMPIIGITSMIIRICVGLAMIKYKLKAAYICGGGLVFGGLVTLISGIGGESSISFQMVFAVLFGIALAVVGSLRPIIYVDILGLENLTSAIGLTSVAMALGGFFGPAIGGVLRTKTDGYNATFIFSGLCVLLSGIIYLILAKVYVLERSGASSRKVRFYQRN